MVDPFTALNVVGTGVGLASGLFQKDAKQKRIEEEYNKKAYGSLQNAQEANKQMSPEATRRAQLGQLSEAKEGAVDNALNMAAGQVASTGGGVINGKAGLAGVSAATAAATPYAQQGAAIEGQKLQNEQAIVARDESLGNSIASLSNHVSYLQEQARNPLKAALEGSLAGATAAGAMGDLLNNKDIQVMKTDADGTGQPTMVLPPETNPAPGQTDAPAVAGPSPAPMVGPPDLIGPRLPQGGMIGPPTAPMVGPQLPQGGMVGPPAPPAAASPTMPKKKSATDLLELQFPWLGKPMQIDNTFVRGL